MLLLAYDATIIRASFNLADNINLMFPHAIVLVPCNNGIKRQQDSTRLWAENFQTMNHGRCYCSDFILACELLMRNAIKSADVTMTPRHGCILDASTKVSVLVGIFNISARSTWRFKRTTTKGLFVVYLDRRSVEILPAIDQ